MTWTCQGKPAELCGPRSTISIIISPLREVGIGATGTRHTAHHQLRTVTCQDKLWSNNDTHSTMQHALQALI